MAQIETSGGGKGKSHQKKMEIRVDFTPMVDMNMLLITFFMLCTTMIKSQTLQISLPTNEKVDKKEQNSHAQGVYQNLMCRKRYSSVPESPYPRRKECWQRHRISPGATGCQCS